MRTLPLSCNHRSGGVMVIALVAIGIVTIGFSAWVGLLSQRGRAAEIEEHATRRRVAAYNSRAAIREYAFERMITSSGDADGLVSFDPLADQPDFDAEGRPLKGITVTSTFDGGWTGYSMESNTRLAGLNAFSLTWDYPYSKIIDTTATTKALGFVTSPSGRVEQEYGPIASYLKTYIRSRCPVLGGDLLIVHRSKIVPETAPDVAGNIAVNGRVLHFVPELPASSYTARSARFVSRPGISPMTLRPKDLSGNDLAPTNMAWTPVTFGRVGSATDLTGKLNVIDDSGNGGNSLRQKLIANPLTIQNPGGTALVDARGYSNDGLGNATVTPCVGPTNPSDLPSVIIESEVEQLIIEGQEIANFNDYARYRPALAVVYVQDPLSVRKLTTIRLRKQNSRRMVLAVKQSGALAGTPVNVIVEDTNAASHWHVVIIAENTPLIISAGAPVTSIELNGGIQTDSPLTGPGSGQSLNLTMESDTRGLIRLTPRAAWVETIMPDKVPGSTADNTW